MKEIKTILRIIKLLIFKPKIAASEHILGKYNMKAMNFFIAFMSAIYWIFALITERKINQTIVFITILIIGSFLVSIFSVILKKLTVKFYCRLINPHLEYSIPFDFLERILSPYVAALPIFAIILNFVELFYPILNRFNGILLIMWFNLQVYFIISYRITYQNIKICEANKLIQKLGYMILIIFIIQSGIFMLENQGLMQPTTEWPILNYEILEIRVEVYNECQEIFDEVEKTMIAGKGVSYEQLKNIILRTHTISRKVDHLRGNEIKLVRTVTKMAEISNDLYEANMTDNKSELKKILTQYEKEVKTANDIVENYYI